MKRSGSTKAGSTGLLKSTITDRRMERVLRSLALLTVAVTVSIVIILLVDAVTFFSQYSFFKFLFGTKWLPFGEPKLLGVLPLITGTFMVAIGASAIAMPFGLGIAVYLTQYASANTREWLGPVIELLGGIPTVVYGYFALTIVTPFLQTIFPSIRTFNALSASIVVGVGILPMISSVSADSLNQVPSKIKNGGYALGLNNFQVIVRIIIPGAASGIISSFILGFARAVGETMAVTLAAGATPNMSFNYFDGIQTITAFIVQISLGDTPVGSLEYYTIYALGLTLFVMTFIFNYSASLITKKFREKYQ